MQNYLSKGALISPCERYRYTLWREWEEGSGTLLVVGLNPSTADDSRDDTTTRQCVFFARREGCKRLVIVNLFAHRSTFPTELEKDWEGSVGPANSVHLAEEASKAAKIVAAWGANSTMGRDQIVLKLLRTYGDVWCLGTTKTGAPLHPARLAHDLPLRLYYRRSTP